MDRIPKDVIGKIVKYNTENKTRVFVCGGGREVSSEFSKDAYQVGKMLADTHVAYGQGGEIASNTIMGESWRGYHENGGDSSYFFVREVGAPNLEKAIPYLNGLIYVSDILSLIKVQFTWSDIVIIMPGGTGTLIELLGYIEFGYDCEDKKPKIVIYNKMLEDGKRFFDDLFEQFNIERKANFIGSDIINETFVVVDNITDLEKEYMALLEERQMKKEK